MAQDWATAFYHSPAWKKNRANYMRRPLDTIIGTVPPGMCERCFERGELTPAKIVHHKIHLTPMNIDDPHVALSYDNFQRLCQDCHAEVHSGTTQSRVTFDENGRPIPIKRRGYDFTCLSVTDRNRYDSKERHEQDMHQLQAL
jgi:5-methylcytosine-specific restriction endonuclease McrA